MFLGYTASLFDISLFSFYLSRIPTWFCAFFLRPFCLPFHKKSFCCPLKSDFCSPLFVVAFFSSFTLLSQVSTFCFACLNLFVSTVQAFPMFDVFIHTAGLLISDTHTNNYFPTNQKGYDTFETTVGKLSTRRTQIFPDYFCLGMILKVILNNFQNNA